MELVFTPESPSRSAYVRHISQTTLWTEILMWHYNVFVCQVFFLLVFTLGAPVGRWRRWICIYVKHLLNGEKFLLLTTNSAVLTEWEVNSVERQNREESRSGDEALTRLQTSLWAE